MGILSRKEQEGARLLKPYLGTIAGYLAFSYFSIYVAIKLWEEGHKTFAVFLVFLQFCSFVFSLFVAVANYVTGETYKEAHELIARCKITIETYEKLNNKSNSSEHKMEN